MRLTLVLIVLGMVLPASAQEIGPETGLAMPRFVSLKAALGNVRRGPGLTHRIDWQFLHRGTPLMVVAEYDNWRRVEDVEGEGGWIHFSLLSGNRTALVLEQEIALHAAPQDGARVVARAERGAILRLGDCTGDWCALSAEGIAGHALAASLWGTDSDLPE